jgi:uncharacterized protein YndB with AHSA1/START domain
MSVTHADFTLERRYRCTPRETFSAFSDPGLRRRWFANPGDWPDAAWELDFRVGGSELSSGGAPGARFNEYRATFHDIVEDERIVYAYDLLHDHHLVSVSLATVELFPDAGATRLVLTEHGAFFDAPDGALVRQSGTGTFLDALGRLLAGEPVR